MKTTRNNPRTMLVVGLGLVALAVTIVIPPIVQWKDYHAFADGRSCGSVPNALNVLSNLPFIVVGLVGLWFLRKPSPAVRESWERGPMAILMIAFLFVGVGSSYYHWQPDNHRLLWDRLGLALIFSSILGITLIERVSLRWGALLFFPLLAAGVASVLYWHYGNEQGHGDLRWYILVQGGAVLAVPLLVYLYPARYTRGRDLIVIVAIYAVAKVFELYDAPVFRAGHLVSGHTIKHILSGLAAWQFFTMVRRRRPVESTEPAPALQTAAID